MNCTSLLNVVTNPANTMGGTRTDHVSNIPLASSMLGSILDNNIVFTFITGFIISRYITGSNIGLTISNGATSTTYYGADFTTNGTCVVTYSQYDYILIDFDQMQGSVGNIVTWGRTIGTNNAQTSWPILNSSVNFFTFAGLGSFSFASTAQISLQNDGSFSILSTSGY
jgi:hypothetical protein